MPTDGITLTQLDAYLRQRGSVPPKYELWTTERHRYPYGQVSLNGTLIVYKTGKEWVYARVATWPVGRTVGQRVSRRALEMHLHTLMYDPVDQ